MGAKLEAFYAQADQLGGVKAKVKLAMLTKLSAKAASEAPDSPENLKMMQEAMVELKKALG